jgi:hypothetical protein
VTEKIRGQVAEVEATKVETYADAMAMGSKMLDDLAAAGDEAPSDDPDPSVELPPIQEPFPSQEDGGDTKDTEDGDQDDLDLEDVGALSKEIERMEKSVRSSPVPDQQDDQAQAPPQYPSPPQREPAISARQEPQEWAPSPAGQQVDDDDLLSDYDRRTQARIAQLEQYVAGIERHNQLLEQEREQMALRNRVEAAKAKFPNVYGNQESPLCKLATRSLPAYAIEADNNNEPIELAVLRAARDALSLRTVERDEYAKEKIAQSARRSGRRGGGGSPPGDTGGDVPKFGATDLTNGGVRQFAERWLRQQGWR